jgi:glyoxylate reductase
MRILYFDSYRNEAAEHAMGVQYADLDVVFRESDFLSLHTDLNPRTRGLLNREAFSRMKPTAIIINTARGPIIDAEALYEALSSGRIAGAALDVTDPEPVPLDSPLTSLQNCLIVPHIASASYATRAEMARMAAANLIAGLRGERLPDCVNPEVYEGLIRT